MYALYALPSNRLITVGAVLLDGNNGLVGSFNEVDDQPSDMPTLQRLPEST